LRGALAGCSAKRIEESGSRLRLSRASSAWVDVAAVAEQLEVAEVVASTLGDRYAMVDLQPVGGAASDAGAVARSDGGASLAPVPAAVDLASG